MKDLVYFQVLDLAKVESYCAEKGLEKPHFFKHNNENWALCNYETWGAIYSNLPYSALGCFIITESTACPNEVEIAFNKVLKDAFTF